MNSNNFKFEHELNLNEALMKSEETDLNIYKTCDYDRFKIYEKNRIVKPNSLLEQDILECNKLCFHPITVNGDFYIIDGQNRFSIAKKHNLAVYYMVDYDDDADDNLMKIQSAKTWGFEDYTRFFEKSGNIEYIKLMQLHRKTKVRLHFIAEAFSKNNSSKKSNFKSGKFCFNEDYFEIEKKCYYVAELEKHILDLNLCDKIPSAFEYSLIRLVKHEGYSQKRMISAINLYPDEVVKALSFSKKENIMTTLKDNIYNKRLKHGRI